MNVIPGVIIWIVVVIGSAWIQLDGIHHLFDVGSIFAVIIFVVSAVIFPPASAVWFIAGLVSYF